MARAANPVGAPDDHFLCYKAKTTNQTPKLQPAGIHLVDRFDDADFDAKGVQLLCNPADKNGEGIVDASIHLRGYKIRQSRGEPKHVKQLDVRVLDMITGSETELRLDTKKPDLLLVPSAKCVDDPPGTCPVPLPAPDNGAHSVDHYKCYKTKVTKNAPKFPNEIEVDLEDQFTTTPAGTPGVKRFGIVRPTHLCTPVDKNGEGIKNSEGTLTCYRTRRSNGEARHSKLTAVRTSDQFGQELVDTKVEKTLCVPSVIRCGNGVIDSGEDCDGAQDAACPGLCDDRCFCPAVIGATIDIPSAAEPLHTPGSSGVVVTNPRLLAQFGEDGFSLNNARYVRFRFDRENLTPDAILILIPGFAGGANTFTILAEQLLQRANVDRSMVLEVWAFDRRTNQLEDLAGLQIAEELENPEIALDWLYGEELALPLHKKLKKLGRRAVFYNAQSDTAFMAEWTNLAFSRDIDAVVAAARDVAANDNVFLGGHSAGTGFTARYASTDFNLTGAGSPDPGYVKLRGLVLLEGGGGSTAGDPLTADSLDRIIAKFDGGLFGAVRDNARRCVNGTTPCTIANEATTCAALTPPKCTEPTSSYTTGLGLLALNPRLLASVEPSGIQGINDLDGGQLILQVNQVLIPGNNAIDAVPGLGPLAILPPATVAGGIGNFLDDDQLIAQFASFVATSLGAQGPQVNGLTTWLDLDESASFPACPGPGCVTPDNGPQPTSLPATIWGVEKEVTRLDRMVRVLFAGGSNFTDWYYPNAGPSTTRVAGVCSGLSGTCTVGNVGAPCSGSDQAEANAACSQAIGLDSTALSIGRGRPDIENLTQATNIDLPVIAFGGSNGITPVGASFLAFAESIGTCSAPSCDGTARVVDAALPNPAFPTYGGTNGGFEVHISEGFGHVDIVTAEDSIDNQVIAPLIDFLERNAQ